MHYHFNIECSGFRLKFYNKRKTRKSSFRNTTHNSICFIAICQLNTIFLI